MKDVQILITIIIVAAVTALIRFTPFLLFPNGKKAPAFITWLGARLPIAVMGMLVIYCLKDVHFSAAPGWLPALAGVAVTAALHAWKRNIKLSIVSGTAVYMLLIRVIA